MSWLFPAGIIGALALVAIVVLHMRHRLPDVVRFPQLAFWPRVPSESRESPRWRRPPLSALFLLQLLAALLLVLAFMRPALPDLGIFGGQRTSAVQHLVVLDGSTSMLAETPDGDTRWDRARIEADAALDGWQQGDGVTVVIAAAQPVVRSAADERELDALRAWLATAALPGGAPDADTVSRLVAGAALSDLDRAVTVISDGGVALDGEAMRVTVGEPVGNVAITNVSTAPRDGGGQVIEAVVLQDLAGTETLPWVASGAEQTLASGTLTLAPGRTGTISAEIPAGVDRVTLELAVEDALPADNRAIVPLAGDTLTGVRIVLVSDVPGPTERALAVLPGASVERYPTTTPGITAIATGADLVVYEASAPSPGDVPSVPMLLVQPTGVDEAWQLTGVAPDPTLVEARLDDPVLRDVTLEGVRFGETPVYVLADDAEVLAAGSDSGTEVPLVWRGTLEGQSYLAWAFDPARSSIAGRVSFPVLVAQSVFSLAETRTGGIVAPGERVELAVPDEAARARVVTPSGRAFSVAPDSDGTVTFTATADPGPWSIAIEDAEGVELDSGALVVGIGDAAEAQLRSVSPVTVAIAPEAAGGEPVSTAGGRMLEEIWPLLVVAAVAVIGIEWWLWLARSLGGRRTPEGQVS